jgi:hypothetical protein
MSNNEITTSNGKDPTTVGEVYSVIVDLQKKHPPGSVLVAEFDGIIPSQDELNESFKLLDPSAGPGEIIFYIIAKPIVTSAEIAPRIPVEWLVNTPHGLRYRTLEQRFYILIKKLPIS